LDEHTADTSTPWRSADGSADALVLASWFVVVALALLLLRPPASDTRPELSGSVSIEMPADEAGTSAMVSEPDFYPWIRPAPVGPAPEAVARWTEPRKPRSGGFLTRLNAPLEDPVFRASDHGNFNTFYGGDWVPENVQSRNGGAFLEVRRITGAPAPFSAAEMQSQKTYQYGRYEAVMQPARGSGLVTAFFTYTGAWFGDPHDEVDIEFLGSDTTRIHFNYFRKGKTTQPATFDLPFDAADAPHLYAFEWRPDGITWFVDGVPYYATQPGDPGIPQTAGKVMISTWTGTKQMEGWHGKPLFRDGAGTQFNCISFTPLGHETPQCSDTYRATASQGRGNNAG